MGTGGEWMSLWYPMKYTTAVHQHINVHQFKVPMYVHIRRYVPLKCIVCKDAVGQTPEKRHLGRESSGALVCMGNTYKQYTEWWNTKRCITNYTCVTLRSWNEWQF